MASKKKIPCPKCKSPMLYDIVLAADLCTNKDCPFVLTDREREHMICASCKAALWGQPRHGDSSVRPAPNICGCVKVYCPDCGLAHFYNEGELVGVGGMLKKMQAFLKKHPVPLFTILFHPSDYARGVRWHERQNPKHKPCDSLLCKKPIIAGTDLDVDSLNTRLPRGRKK